MLVRVLEVLTTAWTPGTVTVALVGGLALGYMVLGYLGTLPTYASAATPGQSARLVIGASIFMGLVFYLGQALVDEDTERAQRLVSRWTLWCVYSIAIGAGTWLRLRRELRRKARAVRAQAVAEVSAENGDS